MFDELKGVGKAIYIRRENNKKKFPRKKGEDTKGMTK
jgi:hypothetical protein